MSFEMKSHLPQEALEPGTEISSLFWMLPQHPVSAITIIFLVLLDLYMCFIVTSLSLQDPSVTMPYSFLLHS